VRLWCLLPVWWRGEEVVSRRGVREWWGVGLAVAATTQQTQLLSQQHWPDAAAPYLFLSAVAASSAQFTQHHYSHDLGFGLTQIMPAFGCSSARVFGFHLTFKWALADGQNEASQSGNAHHWWYQFKSGSEVIYCLSSQCCFPCCSRCSPTQIHLRLPTHPYHTQPVDV